MLVQKLLQNAHSCGINRPIQLIIRGQASEQLVVLSTGRLLRPIDGHLSRSRAAKNQHPRADHITRVASARARHHTLLLDNSPLVPLRIVLVHVVKVLLNVLLVSAEHEQLVVVRHGRVAAATARTEQVDQVGLAAQNLKQAGVVVRGVRVQLGPLARGHVERVQVVAVEVLAGEARSAQVHAAAKHVDNVADRRGCVKIAPERPHSALASIEHVTF